MLVREGVRALLDSYDDIEVVGVAADAPDLLTAAARFVPDVVVTDIKMPPSFQLEGIDCAHAIRATHPDTGVVVLSAHDDEEYALALLGRGHSGLAYLLKDRISQGDELARAIREVHAGGSTVDPTIAERLSGRDDARDQDREVLDMMAKGLGYAEMAAPLGTTQEAVDRQVTDLFGRMAGEAAGSGLVDEFKRLHSAVVEQTASRRTLASFVPQQLADRLAAHPETAIEPQEVEVSVLFSDIRGFSAIAERLSARDVAGVVGRHLSAMAEVVLAHGGTIDKFQGDAVMAIFGAPDPQPDHAERALLRDRDADAPGGAERRRMGRRRRRPRGGDRGEHRLRDRRDGRRRRSPRVHGGRRRGQRRPAAAIGGAWRRDRGRRGDGGGRPGRCLRARRSPAREGQGGARRGVPDPARRSRLPDRRGEEAWGLALGRAPGPWRLVTFIALAVYVNELTGSAASVG